MESIIILVPIENVEELMHQGIAASVHCNGIDLCHVPSDKPGREHGYDFVLLGHQKYAGSANIGDMATVTLIDIEAQFQKIMQEQAQMNDAVSKYKQVKVATD